MPQTPYRRLMALHPVDDVHTHTIISLHGRGSDGEAYGEDLLTYGELEDRLPTVKFIFPTARKRQAAALDESPFPQWFDIWSLNDPNEKTDIQVEGLCDSAEYIRRLIDEEARILGKDGYKKIILWGASQGCASSLFTLLGGWPDIFVNKQIGAFVGLSGWIPFEQEIRQTLRRYRSRRKARSVSRSPRTYCSETDDENTVEQERGEVSNGFKTSSDSNGRLCRQTFQWDNLNPFAKEEDGPPLVLALNSIRRVLDLPKIPIDDPEKQQTSDFSHLGTPVFIGHGQADTVIPSGLAKRMTDMLSTGLGMDVTRKIYRGLGHDYRTEDEIEDVLNFLHDKVDLPV